MRSAPGGGRRWALRAAIRAGLVGALLSSLAAPAVGQQPFGACLDDLQTQARRAGVPEGAVGEIAALRYQPRVIELDRSQPEFRQSFSAYLRARVSDSRVQQGREELEKQRRLLARITQQTGVPGRYLVALWGLETNYGGYLGKMPTLDSLATLACDERRSEFFRAELFLALRLMDRESLTPDAMQGSWAGAVGHTQFMPSSYYTYAVDGDGDGKVDLWRSEADALSSGANYLSRLGWQRGERWGREVRLPAEFPYAETGLGRTRLLREWRELGVRRADGRPLQDAEIEASILVPMGHAGPAFAVYPNFRVLMRWNRSESYAIAAGHLADRIAGGGGLVATLPEVATAPSAAVVSRLQERLMALGFEPGTPDGIMGPATRSALRAFQIDRALIADGYPGPETLASLGVAQDGPAND